MTAKPSGCRGFALFEVLLALLVWSLAAGAVFGALTGILKFSSAMNRRTEAMALAEELLFRMEAGERSDLLFFGGRDTAGDFSYEVRSEPVTAFSRHVKLRILAPGSGCSLEAELIGRIGE